MCMCMLLKSGLLCAVSCFALQTPSTHIRRYVVTPRRACAKQGLCDRLCPFIYLFYLSLHKTVNLSKYPSMATEKLQ